MRGMPIFLRKIDSTVAVPVYTIWENAIVNLGFAIHTEPFIRSAVRADGKSYTIVSSTATNPPSFRVDQEVEVLYRKGKPGGAVIDSFWELWPVSMILIFIGVAHGVISGCCFLVERRLDRKAQSVALQHSLRG